MRIIIIHGPNMNVLDKRDKSVYGNYSIEDVNNMIFTKAVELGIDIEIYQFNSEGDIINKLQETINSEFDGVIINPAGYTHYSISIRDTIELLSIPVIEVHLSNIYGREDFRKKSVIAPVCKGQISGLGGYSYILALEAFNMLKDNL